MTHKTRNLLEAFQASSAAAEKQQRATPRPPGGVEAAAGGSVPAPPAAAKGPPAPPAAPRPPAPARKAWRPSQVHRLAALQALLLVLAFLLGRLTAGGGEAEAAPPAGDRESGERVASPAPDGLPTRAPQASRPEPVAVSRTPLTRAEQELDDPANVWTLVLAEYDLGGGEAFARKAYEHLSAMGLPVARTTKDKRMFLVAGAAKERAELDGLLAKVKTLKGPTGAPNEFDTAYTRKIDSVLQRRGRP